MPGMPPASEPLPLSEHRARVLAYLRGATLSLQSVAWTIIEEGRDGSDSLMLRPSLVLWACAACGGESGEFADALPVAAAFDLFDRFMLLHDVLIEETAPAAGGPFGEVVARWGLGQSLNAGDALYAMALRALAQDVTNAERRLSAASLVAHAVLEAIEGRSSDVERAPGAALTGAALESGALIAGANPAVCRGFNRAGRLLASAGSSGDARLAQRLAEKAIGLIQRCIPERRYVGAFEFLARHVAADAA